MRVQTGRGDGGVEGRAWWGRGAKIDLHRLAKRRNSASVWKMSASVRCSTAEFEGQTSGRKAHRPVVEEACFLDATSFLAFVRTDLRAAISFGNSSGTELAQKSSHVALDADGVRLLKWEETAKYSAIILSDFSCNIWRHDHAVRDRWELCFKLNLRDFLQPAQGHHILDLWLDLTVRRLFYLEQSSDQVAVKQSIVSVNDVDHTLNLTPGLSLYTLQRLVCASYYDHVLWTVDCADGELVLSANSHAVGKVFRAMVKDLDPRFSSDAGNVALLSQISLAAPEPATGASARNRLASTLSGCTLQIGHLLAKIQCDSTVRRVGSSGKMVIGLKLVGVTQLSTDSLRSSVLACDAETCFLLQCARSPASNSASESITLWRWNLASGRTALVRVPLPLETSMASLRILTRTALATWRSSNDLPQEQGARLAIGWQDNKLVYLDMVSTAQGDLHTWSLSQWLAAAIPSPIQVEVDEGVGGTVQLPDVVRTELAASCVRPTTEKEDILPHDALLWGALRQSGVLSLRPMPNLSSSAASTSPVESAANDSLAIEDEAENLSPVWMEEAKSEALAAESDESRGANATSSLALPAWLTAELETQLWALPAAKESHIDFLDSQASVWWDQLDILTLQPRHDNVRDTWQALVGRVDPADLAAVMEALAALDQQQEGGGDREPAPVVSLLLHKLWQTHGQCGYQTVCGLLDAYCVARGCDLHTILFPRTAGDEQLSPASPSRETPRSGLAASFDNAASGQQSATEDDTNDLDQPGNWLETLLRSSFRSHTSFSRRSSPADVSGTSRPLRPLTSTRPSSKTIEEARSSSAVEEYVAQSQRLTRSTGWRHLWSAVTDFARTLARRRIDCLLCPKHRPEQNKGEEGWRGEEEEEEEEEELCKVLLLTGQVLETVQLLIATRRCKALVCLASRIAASANYHHVQPVLSYAHGGVCEYAYYDPSHAEYYSSGRGRSMLREDVRHGPPLPSNCIQSSFLSMGGEASMESLPRACEESPMEDKDEGEGWTEQAGIEMGKQRMRLAQTVFEASLRALSRGCCDASLAEEYISSLVRYRPLSVTAESVMAALREASLGESSRVLAAVMELI